jgi:ribosomal protein S18 acetylase RimI-like enzyme
MHQERGSGDGGVALKWAVREAAKPDVQRLALVGSATFLETFAGILDGAAILDHCERANSVATYSECLDAGARAWLAEVEPGAAPVGFALLTLPHLPGAMNDGSDLELKRIYVLSRLHGSVVGAALMQKAVLASREMGARRLLLGVYAENKQAQSFYGKHGFVQIASRRFAVGSQDYDDTVFCRTLA